MNYQNQLYSHQLKCEKHKKVLRSICTAPECFHYRELCIDCEKEDSHHKKMQFLMDDAYEKVYDEIENIFKGLKVLRTKIIQKMDINMNNNESLKQVSARLESIRQMLNEKIDEFRTKLYQIYETNIKKKLGELFLVVEKSYEFLEHERSKLIKTKKIKSFLTNDLSHELKYYESYFEELLGRNLRKFKTGVQRDKVMKLAVAFEQNLNDIFNLSNQSLELASTKPHLFHSDITNHHLLSLKKTVVKKQLDFIPENLNWIGTAPSIYYGLNENHYLFGEGKRQSNRIAKIHLDTKQFKLLDIKMETKRSHFSVILINDQIYIVGGQNSSEGCLVKCEKFIPSEGKTYIVSSLNQRSAQHSLCAYKNKYILKFGGTDLMQGILQSHHHERFKPLNPEIYCLNSEEWRIINLSFNNTPFMQSPINFGLWPAVFQCQSKDKIVVLQGDQLKNRLYRIRYDIKMPKIQMSDKSESLWQYNSSDDLLTQLKIETSNIDLPPQKSEIKFHSQCQMEGGNGQVRFIVEDLTKNRFSIFNFVIRY